MISGQGTQMPVDVVFKEQDSSRVLVRLEIHLIS